MPYTAAIAENLKIFANAADKACNVLDQPLWSAQIRWKLPLLEVQGGHHCHCPHGKLLAVGAAGSAWYVYVEGMQSDTLANRDALCRV